MGEVTGVLNEDQFFVIALVGAVISFTAGFLVATLAGALK